MSVAAKYTGEWVDEQKRILLIREDLGAVVVDCYSNGEKKPIERIKPPKPSVNMKTYFEELTLVVELGIDGLGLILRLDAEGNDVLRPSVDHGLYDDYEDDFGVPWIFPLSIYRRRA